MVSTIGIISLSSGIIGEDFVKHEVDLGVQRLKDLCHRWKRYLSLATLSF